MTLTTIPQQNALTIAQLDARNRKAINKFLDQYKGSPNTRAAYERALKRIARIGGSDDIYSVPFVMANYEAALEIKNALIETGKYKPSTINHTLSALRQVAETMFNLEYITADQCKHIQAVYNVKTGGLSNPYQFVQKGDIDRLYQHVRGLEGIPAVRNLAILATLQHGLRVSEVVGLTLSNYDAKTGALTFTGKGSKERTVPLKPFAVDFVKAWLAIRGNEPGALFCAMSPGKDSTPQLDKHLARQTINYMIHHWTAAVGLDHITPHDFRRFFVSILLEKGYDYGEIKEFTGHADIRTVARYDVRGKKELFQRFQNEKRF